MSPNVHQDCQGRQVKPGDFLTDSFITVQVVNLHCSGQFVYADETGALVTNFCCCFTVCASSAQQSPSDSLAAPAEAGQGVCIINVDDEIHVALSDVFGRLRDSGLSVAGANSAIYYSLFRLGYLDRRA